MGKLKSFQWQFSIAKVRKGSEMIWDMLFHEGQICPIHQKFHVSANNLGYILKNPANHPGQSNLLKVIQTYSNTVQVGSNICVQINGTRSRNIKHPKQIKQNISWNPCCFRRIPPFLQRATSCALLKQHLAPFRRSILSNRTRARLCAIAGYSWRQTWRAQTAMIFWPKR